MKFNSKSIDAYKADPASVHPEHAKQIEQELARDPNFLNRYFPPRESEERDRLAILFSSGSDAEITAEFDHS